MATTLSIEREAQARREVGETTFGPGVKWFLGATFVVMVVATTVSHLVSDTRAEPGAWPAMIDPARLLPGWAEVTWTAEQDGWLSALGRANDRTLANIADYESTLEDGSPMVRAIVPVINQVVTSWLGGSTESVYPGRDGWLFYRRDIDYVTGPAFLAPESLAAEDREADPLPAIVELRDMLLERDILLLVAPVPVKPTIHPDRFSGRYESPDNAVENASYAKFLAGLADAGIHHVDLTSALWEARSRDPEPLYLETDTHWSPTGVQVAAQAIAAAVVAMDLSWTKPAVAYRTTALEAANIGDIRSMLRLRNGEAERAILRQVIAPDGAEVLGASAEVLLLGDSFANIYSHPTLGWGTGAGLAEHLAAGLGRSVDKLAINDNASHATRFALAGDIARGGNRIAGKRVVIYQFATRELAHGDWRTGLP